MEWVVELAIGMVVIPWVCWVTVSLFNQRQELAILKHGNELNKEIYELLKSRLT